MAAKGLIRLNWRSAIFVIALIVHVIDAFSQKRDINSRHGTPVFPNSPAAIVKEAAKAISHAFLEDSIHRQIVRLPLSEAMYSEKEESFVADRAVGWQGGPQETYRYLSPMASQMLRMTKTTRENTGDIPPRIKEQCLLGFDGSSLLTAECAIGPLGDAQALLQPNTDSYYLKTISMIEEQFSDTPGKQKRLFLLVNPAWRDASSFGIFGSQKAQTKILDRYETTFAIDQFIVRGQKLSLLRSWPHDWNLFWAPLEKSSLPQFIGSFSKRPEYSEMDDLLKQAMKDKLNCS